jgi:hypothetical protein
MRLGRGAMAGSAATIAADAIVASHRRPALDIEGNDPERRLL